MRTFQEWAEEVATKLSAEIGEGVPVSRILSSSICEKRYQQNSDPASFVDRLKDQVQVLFR